MYFLSGEWEFVLVRTGNTEELISFSWRLGQGVSHLPLPQRAHTAVSAVCLK